MQVSRYSVGPMDNNTYLVADAASRDAAIIDPSFDSAALWPEFQAAGWKIAWVLNTHAHIDHVVENAFWTGKTGAPLAIHAADVPLLEALPEQAMWFGKETPAIVAPGRLLTDGDTIALDDEALTVIHTPGHSPGGVCFIGDGFAIVGDVLFASSIGRCDLPGGDHSTLLASIRERLLTLPDDTIVYPGHGPRRPPSVVKDAPTRFCREDGNEAAAQGRNKAGARCRARHPGRFGRQGHRDGRRYGYRRGG